MIGQIRDFISTKQSLIIQPVVVGYWFRVLCFAVELAVRLFCFVVPPVHDLLKRVIHKNITLYEDVSFSTGISNLPYHSISDTDPQTETIFFTNRAASQLPLFQVVNCLLGAVMLLFALSRGRSCRIPFLPAFRGCTVDFC